MLTRLLNNNVVITYVVVFCVGLFAGVRIHMGIVALDKVNELIDKDIIATEQVSESAKVILKSTTDIDEINKVRAELNNVISKYRKKERERVVNVEVPTTCPVVTCIDGLFINTWNDIATGTSKPDDPMRKSGDPAPIRR